MSVFVTAISTYLRRWSRRVVVSGNVAAQGLIALLDDFRLLAGRWKGDIAFRQKRIDGFEMLVRADEDLGRAMYCFGSYEKEECTYIRQNIKETDTCFDIGANVGYYTLLLAAVARRGVVHSFEPVPLNYHLLNTNILVSGLQNVVANCCAIADLEGEADFVVAKDGAFSSFLDTGRKPSLARIRVLMTTLDQYCRQRGVSRIDFLKADVEGAEEMVLRGAAEVLGDPRRKPRLIMLELYEPMLDKYGSSIDGILARMQGFGYRPFIRRNGQALPFTKEYYNNFVNVFFSQDRAAIQENCPKKNESTDSLAALVETSNCDKGSITCQLVAAPGYQAVVRGVISAKVDGTGGRALAEEELTPHNPPLGNEQVVEAGAQKFRAAPADQKQ